MALNRAVLQYCCIAISSVIYNIHVSTNRVEKSGLGCRIGVYYSGAFGYAGDLTLLIPTVNGLHKIVNI